MKKTKNKEIKEIEQMARAKKKLKTGRYSFEQKALIVKAYLSKEAKIKDLEKEYGVSRVTIWNWSTKFADGTMLKTQPGASAADTAADADPTSQPEELTQTPIPMPKKTVNGHVSSSEELKVLQEENRRLQEELEMANLKVHVRDVMIDIAEKTFNIPIRKKSGRK